MFCGLPAGRCGNTARSGDMNWPTVQNIDPHAQIVNKLGELPEMGAAHSSGTGFGINQ